MGGRQHRAYGAGCSDNQGKELGQHKGPVIKAVKTVRTEEPFTPRHPVQGHPSPALLTTARQAHPWGTLHLYGGGASPPDTSSQEGHHPPQHQLLLSCLLFEARSSCAAQTGLELQGGSRLPPPPKSLGLCMGLMSPPMPNTKSYNLWDEDSAPLCSSTTEDHRNKLPGQAHYPVSPHPLPHTKYFACCSCSLKCPEDSGAEMGPPADSVPTKAESLVCRLLCLGRL